jgi:uncharacterized protein (DUF2164 family)
VTPAVARGWGAVAASRAGPATALSEHLTESQDEAMAVTLAPDAKKQAIASIRRYVAESWDLDVGDLKADLLLDFVLREIGPTVYNQAIADAQVYLRERVADLEAACYEKEFTYWPPASQRAKGGC